MGKCKDPKWLLLDSCFAGTPEHLELESKGHTVNFMDFTDYDMVVSPVAQMTPPGRLAYVVKKLKDIVKDVAK